MSVQTPDRRSSDFRRNGGQEPFSDEFGLVEALRNHHPDALEAVVSAYGRMIANWARAAGPDAEDVVQDVLMRVWRSAPGLRADTHLPSWLKTVTSNALRDRWRKSGRRPEVVSDTAANALSIDETPQVTSRIAVEQIMSSMAVHERDVLNLMYMSDLSLADTARELGLSEEATKSLAARARRRLRDRMSTLVAASPAATIGLLVGRAAEALSGAAKAAGIWGAAAAAAAAIAVGTVSIQHADKPQQVPAAKTAPVHAATAGSDAASLTDHNGPSAPVSPVQQIARSTDVSAPTDVDGPNSKSAVRVKDPSSGLNSDPAPCPSPKYRPKASALNAGVDTTGTPSVDSENPKPC